RSSPFLRYGVAVIAIALALGLKLLVDPLIAEQSPFLLLAGAVMVAAWFGGLGPGLLATALGAVVSDYYFLPPLGSFTLPGVAFLPLLLFVLQGALISLLAEALRSARRRAEASTEQTRRHQESLRQSEERFRLLVEGVRDYAIFMLDPEGRVATWNEGAQRINGYEAQEILGRHFSVFYTEDDVERGHPGEELRAAQEEGRYEEEGLRVRKDGSTFWASVLISALRDEEGNLRGFSKVVRDITERKRAEAELRRSLDSLLAVYEAGQVLGSTLEREQIGSELLGITQRISNLSAAGIDLLEEDQQLCTLRATGSEDLWRRARSAPAAKAARRAALETEEPRSFELPSSGANGARLVGLCVPLRVRDRVVGLLETYGSEALAEKENVETLTSLASQGASALENARLYEELSERERQLRDLVGRILVAEEEERRRVAYEVHDGLTQMVVATHQRLQMFAEDHAPGSAEGREELEVLIELVRGTVAEARRVIADLRPTTLDDLGLATAIRLQVEEMRAGGYEASFEEALGDERLPATLETTLFRVAQEALTNVRKHAKTDRVHVTLGHRADGVVRLEVRDWGRGFVPSEVAVGDGPGERVGLSSMRERVALLGGHLEIRSEPGRGTSVVAEVPPVMEGDGHGG
ncbi:MAG: PAS domain S-box protein, partial [Actinomycetota bacterium]|nr:PAS domain S-box protein [Actinomycetota bacterium]